MRQTTKPRLRLLAFNLVIVLLCSLALPISASAAGGENISLYYGESDQSGTGWTYDSSERLLSLSAGSYGRITVTGDLILYTNGNVSLRGISVTPSTNSTPSNPTNLDVRVDGGSLTVDNSSGNGDAISVGGQLNPDGIASYCGTTLIRLNNAQFTVKGGKNGCGIDSNGGILINDREQLWTDAAGKQHYDGRVGSSSVSITGGSGSGGYGVRSLLVWLDADGTITGGSSSAAAYCNSLYVGNGEDAASSTSTVHMTLKRGSATNSAAVSYMSSESNVVGTHIEMKKTMVGITPQSLEFYPKTYTTTINGNGGTANGQKSVTLSQAYPAHVKLAEQNFTYTGHDLTGYQMGKSTVAVDYEFIPTADSTLTAQWKFAGKIDVSDQITFTAKQAEATYTGLDMALSSFVNEATCSAGSGAITYTLSQDGGTAQAVTLSDTVKDAGTYTVTATYEDENNFGTKSLSFTIQKANPVLTVTPEADPLTVIINTEKTVPASAKLGETVLPITVTSSNEKAAAVTYSQGNVTVKGIAAGEATITVSYPGDNNINVASKSFQVKVIDLPPQEIAFAEAGDRTATYGDPAFTNVATNSSQGGGAISYSSSNQQVATVDANGQVTILATGETTITATAATVEGTWAETSVSYKLTVAKKPLTVQATASEKTYDGTTDADVTVTFQGLVGQDTLTPGADYTFTASYADANAGTDKTITGTVTLKNTAKTANYVLSDGSFSLADGVITQAPGKDITQTINVRFDDTSLKTASAANVLPADAGNLAYTLGQILDDGNILAAGTAMDGASSALTFALKEGLDWETDVGKTAQAPILITSTNFADSTATMKVNVVYEYVPVVDVENISVTYSGQALSQDVIHGTATYDGVEVPGTWSFQADSAPVSAGIQPVVVIFTPDDLETYAPVEATILVTIQKADPSGKPGYTPITQEGKTLADAALNIGTILPAEGTLTWNDGDATIVTANTAYGWTFVPDDTDNYNVLTGSITPYARSSGGGGGSSSVNIIVKTDGHGKITVSPRSASKGDTVTITVKPNEGYELDELIVTDRNGDTIKLSQKDDNQYTFTMPSIRATVEATFQKVEESSALDFTDVPTSAYYYDAVKWAVENGITSGTSATTFSPDAGCTRGQVVTFLWQAFGRPQPKSTQNPFTDISSDDYYYDAVLWAYEQGITSGATATTFAPNATCTRAQIVTFLWQAEGRPSAKADSSFYDVATDAYYAQAVAWAVANDITSGTGTYTFSPDATCTRAQVVTFLYHNMVD
ncbi:S-layer homology domain-containing protein [Flavonifractor sp. An100]|uniref:S-layer homology domain-containing protein n=1 Tax=Flavonifractor sp. An100 TaxID=1965538 RepID=UPI000B37BAD8|nr:S-layer homology domain-containing protein [Flavonifractor sp. An100]OUQ77703.1 hypothetical protein B5E43_09950 [Flavonifractor sp. An100]